MMPTWLADLRPGDILLMRRMEPLSQLIRFVDDLDDPDRPGKPRARHVDASHAAMYLGVSEDGVHLAGSVWPMMDERDVLQVPLLDMLALYAGVVVLRQEHVHLLSEKAWERGLWRQLHRSFLDLEQSARQDDDRLKFNDMRMVAAGLEASWKDVEEFAGLPEFQGKVVGSVVDAVVRDARSRPGLVCPDVFVALYERLGPDFQLLDRQIGDPFAPPAVELNLAVGPHVKRSAILLVCLLTTEWLISRYNEVEQGVRAVAGQDTTEFVTPGQLARSDRLVPILAVDAYADVVERGEGVWNLTRARDAVRCELTWAPGVQPVDLDPPS